MPHLANCNHQSSALCVKAKVRRAFLPSSPSLAQMLERWCSTVRMLINSSSAICWLFLVAATNFKTRCSPPVNEASGDLTGFSARFRRLGNFGSYRHWIFTKGGISYFVGLTQANRFSKTYKRNSFDKFFVVNNAIMSLRKS